MKVSSAYPVCRCIAFLTARGAPPPRARAPALEDSLSSRGPQAPATPAWIHPADRLLRRAGKPARCEGCARTIEHNGDNRRTPDDDPFVILVEVQRADRLTDEDDE